MPTSRAVPISKRAGWLDRRLGGTGARHEGEGSQTTPVHRGLAPYRCFLQSPSASAGAILFTGGAAGNRWPPRVLPCRPRPAGPFMRPGRRHGHACPPRASINLLTACPAPASLRNRSPLPPAPGGSRHLAWNSGRHIVRTNCRTGHPGSSPKDTPPTAASIMSMLGELHAPVA